MHELTPSDVAMAVSMLTKICTRVFNVSRFIVLGFCVGVCGLCHYGFAVFARLFAGLGVGGGGGVGNTLERHLVLHL